MGSWKLIKVVETKTPNRLSGRNLNENGELGFGQLIIELVIGPKEQIIGELFIVVNGFRCDVMYGQFRRGCKMANCPKCGNVCTENLEVCSQCGDKYMIETNIENKISEKRPLSFKYRLVLMLCILYAVIGGVVWAISFIDTNWSEMRPLCCGDCDSMWYSKYWGYYFYYTFPFMLMTFPIYMHFYDIENVLFGSIFSLYLLFIPLALLWLGVQIRKFRLKRKINTDL